LAKIDRPPLQVYLDVLIAEVTMSDQESLGAILDLFLKGQIALGQNLPVESFTSTYFADVAAEGQQGLAYSVASPGVFAAMVRTLAKVNRLKVLSEPHIFVHNNTEAKISVGQMVPVRVSESDGTTTTESVEQQEVALTLTVTPRIIHDGTVLLSLSQVVNDVSSENYQGTGAPLITTRDVTSSVVARDGLTVLMGGLISDKRYLDRKGVPLLQDIPLFGRAFRNDVMTQVKTELLVLVTPYIMWTPAHEAFYTNMMNQYVSPWKADEFYLERDSEKIKRLLRELQGQNE
jgi:general secretion pathway protein D